MGTTTARYRFEFRVLEWAEGLGRSLCGERRSLFVGVRADGSVRRMYFADRGDRLDGDRKTRLVEAHPSWLLFVPHAERGSGYLEWFDLPEDVAERWLGRRFQRLDFLDVRTDGEREGWPTTWRALIG